eukprot:09266.XXX_29053_29193_1 [CDS] Oithona nana genome sequencing.
MTILKFPFDSVSIGSLHYSKTLRITKLKLALKDRTIGIVLGALTVS